MTRSPLCSLAALAALAVARPAVADGPTIADVVPAGVRRGVPTVVAFQGVDPASEPRLITPFNAEVTPLPDGLAPAGGYWAITLTVDPSTPIGAYPVRVRTAAGLSAPILLSVGQWPQVRESEPNDAAESATTVAAPIAVEGRAEGSDIDVFRFAGRAGQRLVVDAECARIGSGLDPTLTLTTADGRYVAGTDDAPGLLADARLVADLPVDGDYLVELSDAQYQGNNRPVYRLLIGAVPAASEVFPLGGRRGQTAAFELRGPNLPDPLRVATLIDAPAGADTFFPGLPTGDGPAVEFLHPLAVGDLPELLEPPAPDAPPLRLAPPATVNGRIEAEGDIDRFAVAVRPGRTYRATVEAARHGSILDGALRVLKPDGGQIVDGDDSNIELSNKGRKDAQTITLPDPSADFAVPDGVDEVTIELRDLRGRGGLGFPYRLTVTEVRPTIEVELRTAQVSVPRGGAVNVEVNVARRGFNGPVTLAIADPPAGLTVRDGLVAAGQSNAVLALLAAPDADVFAAPLSIDGRYDGPDGPASAPGSIVVTYANLDGFPALTLPQRGLLAASAPPEPIALSTPAEPIAIVHGYGAPVPIQATRSEGANAALEVSPLPLPGGFAAPNATIAEGSAEGSITVNASPDAPLGRSTIAFVAKGKLNDADRTFAVPAATVEVVRPAELALSAAELTLKAGTTAELAGTLTRRAPFAEAVTVTLANLPAGVTAEPVPVAADATAFTLKLTAAPDAAPSEAAASASASFKIGDKDYPPPTAPLTVKLAPPG